MREYWETFDEFQYEIEAVIHADGGACGCERFATAGA